MSGKEAATLHMHLVDLILHDAGIIDYATNFEATVSRKGMIAEARTMIAEKARQAADSPRERKLAKADAEKAKTKKAKAK